MQEFGTIPILALLTRSNSKLLSKRLHQPAHGDADCPLASFLSLKGMIRDAQARGLIFDVDTAIERLMARIGGTVPQTVELTAIHLNLISDWAKL